MIITFKCILKLVQSWLCDYLWHECVILFQLNHLISTQLHSIFIENKKNDKASDSETLSCTNTGPFRFFVWWYVPKCFLFAHNLSILFFTVRVHSLRYHNRPNTYLSVCETYKYLIDSNWTHIINAFVSRLSLFLHSTYV